MQGNYFEVKDPRITQIMRKIARRIRRMLPRDLHFTLFIFSDFPKSMFYISSLERNSGVDTIEEWVMKEKNRQRGGMN